MPKSNKSRTSQDKKAKSPQLDSRSPSPPARQIESPPAAAAPPKSPFEIPGGAPPEETKARDKSPHQAPTPAQLAPSPEELKEDLLGGGGAFITGKGSPATPAPPVPEKAPEEPVPARDLSREWKIKDILIPAGMPAKLVQVPDPEYEGFRVNEMADRLKFVEPSPVVVLLGAMGTRS